MMSRAYSLLRQIFRTPSKPKSHIDVLKIVAIFMVLYNHTGKEGFTAYTVQMHQPWHWLLLSHAAWIKAAVPLFFMSSGALLLGRDEPFSKTLSKRVLRFAVTLTVASAIVYVLYGQKPLSVQDFLFNLYTNQISTHFWYMYSYIAFLLMTPFLRKIAKGMTESEFVWLICATLIMKLLPVLDYLLFRGKHAHASDFTLFVYVSNVFYPLCGYFIENRMKKQRFSPETMLALLLVTILSFYLTCVLTDWRYDLTGKWDSSNTQTYLSTFVLIPSITFYMLLKGWFDHHPVSPRVGKALSIISGSTFGVYLFEVVFRTETKAVYQHFRPICGDYGAKWIHIFVAYLAGIALSLLFTLVKGLVTIPLQRKLAERVGGETELIPTDDTTEDNEVSGDLMLRTLLVRRRAAPPQDAAQSDPPEAPDKAKG